MAQVQPFPITPAPGVVLTESERIAEGRWIASDGVRWVRGRAQKNGGNVRAVSTPTLGVPRIAHAWRDNQADNFIAVGTYIKLLRLRLVVRPERHHAIPRHRDPWDQPVYDHVGVAERVGQSSVS